MCRCAGVVVVAVAWAAASVCARADDALEKSLEAVFRVTNGRSSGTGFLVTVPGQGGQSSTVLVTAAHVLEEMSEPQCQLILRALSPDETYVRKEVSVPIRDNGTPRWKRHADVDVAALEIQLPAEVAIAPLRYDQLADAGWVADKRLRVGQQVWIPSYPAQLAANDAGWPVLRHGAVASYPLGPVARVKTMLVDVQSFGGESGAPVFALADDGCHVVGLVHGLHRQTEKTVLPLHEFTFHTPLGLSIVLHAAWVRETIELLKPPAGGEPAKTNQ